jgi:hypothetical protein
MDFPVQAIPFHPTTPLASRRLVGLRGFTGQEKRAKEDCILPSENVRVG